MGEPITIEQDYLESDVVKTKKYHAIIDEVESVMVNGDLGDLVEFPVRHFFTPGLYCREIFMPSGSLITSKIHRTEHPYVVSMGKLSVIKEEGDELIEAPFTGVTYPGTRRVLYIHEDTIWTTFHPTNIIPKSVSEEDIQAAVDEIESIIIEPHINNLISSTKTMEELT